MRPSSPRSLCPPLPLRTAPIESPDRSIPCTRGDPPRPLPAPNPPVGSRRLSAHPRTNPPNESECIHKRSMSHCRHLCAASSATSEWSAIRTAARLSVCHCPTAGWRPACGASQTIADRPTDGARGQLDGWSPSESDAIDLRPLSWTPLRQAIGTHATRHLTHSWPLAQLSLRPPIHSIPLQLPPAPNS